MSCSPHQRLVLDPQLTLRNDVDRAVLLGRPAPLGERGGFHRFLHPSEAVVLALFDGERTLQDVCDLWTDLTGKSRTDGAQEVCSLVDRLSSFGPRGEGVWVEVDSTNRDRITVHDPADFVISGRPVDLRDPRFRKPYTVYYLASLFCPQRCVYCYAKTCPRPEQDLIPLGRLREIFAELAELGVEVINLSGGDPLARRDIYDILESLIGCGIFPYLSSKIGLSYRRACELRDLGVDVIQVSLDSTDPDVLDRMVGVPGYHRRAFRLFEDLRRAGLRVRVNSVLTPWNLPTIPALLDYLGELGNVERVMLSPYGRSMFCHRDELFVERSDLEKLERELAAGNGRYDPMRIHLGAPPPGVTDDRDRAKRWRQRPQCTGNRHGFVLLPDGRVTVCEELYDHPAFLIGDLRHQSVMEMWSSPEALALVHPDPAQVPGGPCRSCEGFAACHAGRGRCWRDVLKSYGEDRPHYPDPRCPRAPAAPRLG